MIDKLNIRIDCTLAIHETKIARKIWHQTIDDLKNCFTAAFLCTKAFCLLI